MINIHRGESKAVACTGHLSIYRTIIYQFKQCINFHTGCVIYECCGIARIRQCQGDTCGVIIYSVTQIYVLKGYKTALQPSRSISQLITVAAIYCMCACGEGGCGWGLGGTRGAA